MKLLSTTLLAEREFSAALDALDKTLSAEEPLPVLLNGLSGGALVGALCETVRHAKEKGRIALCLVASDAVARKTAAAMQNAGLSALAFPTRDFVLYPMIASHDTERERLFVLSSVLSRSCDAVIATPSAALQFTMPREKLLSLSLSFEVGKDNDVLSLATRAEGLGYSRVDAVEAPGQYARRGSIFDIFPAGQSAPLRLEYFGDTLERSDYFDPVSQRRTSPAPALTLLPAKEVIATEEDRKTIRAEIEERKKTANENGRARLDAEAAYLDGGLALSFADKYISLLYPEKECLFDYLFSALPPICITLSSDGVKENADGTLALSGELTAGMLEEGSLSPKIAAYYSPRYQSFTSSAPMLHFNSFSGGVGSMRCAGLFGLRCRTGVSYFGKTDLLKEDVDGLLAGGYSVIVECDSQAGREACAECLRDAGYPVHFVDGDTPFSKDVCPAGQVALLLCNAPVQGYTLPTSRIALLSLAAGEEEKKSAPRLRKRQPAGQRILSYADLKEGDLVVHAVHGIGRFGGMTTLQIDGAQKDYFTIYYAGTDKLFLPADRLEMISRYIGADGDNHSVKLSRLGGQEWQKTKSRAKAAAREMAGELVRLYAERSRRPGHAFAKEDQMGRDFLAAFPYDETEAQNEAWEEIARDMESPTPMDRLLCGDVGYGKTEIALRAAFKAVADGKQVAILVPTTILAMQHYETALARMRGFPVTVEMLSRFRTPKQEENILARTAKGEVDILIGTHKLLGKKLAFRDLGLLIVDEEQRFGVAQKEKLKAIAGNVDVLTLTATPIPRTLNMAMNGIRDMSLLDEAPGERLPVQTYVMPHDDLMIAEAIRKELRRGGQVIYLYNRVETMALTEAKLRRELPDARIVAAHGQMDKEDLEEIWQALVRGEIDVILCTTIVETGVDLPNANTLIITDADRLGLSQLHQIRGRVGRSARQAYAYLTYRPDKPLSEVAEKRLQAIREYAAFGAGFRIALRDMEIRGAGNLLGPEQHGYIAAVGYELYVRLLAEAVLEERGEQAEKPFQSQIDVRTDAHIPPSYVPSEAARMELYKKISFIESEEDRADLAGEIADRFGPMPKPVSRLLDVALSRALAQKLHICKVTEEGRTLVFAPEKLDLAPWSVLFAEDDRLHFARGTLPRILCKMNEKEDAAAVAADVLRRLFAATEPTKEKGEPK